MTEDEAYRTVVRQRALRALTQREWSDTQLAAESGVNIDTVSDFLNGRTWPRRVTQARIAEALSDPTLFDPAVTEGSDDWGVIMGTRHASDSPTVRQSVDVALAALLGSRNLDILTAAEIDEIRLAARTASLEQARKIFDRQEVRTRRDALQTLRGLIRSIEADSISSEAAPELAEWRQSLANAIEHIDAERLSPDLPLAVEELRAQIRSFELAVGEPPRALAVAVRHVLESLDARSAEPVFQANLSDRTER